MCTKRAIIEFKLIPSIPIFGIHKPKPIPRERGKSGKTCPSTYNCVYKTGVNEASLIDSIYHLWNQMTYLERPFTSLWVDCPFDTYYKT